MKQKNKITLPGLNLQLDFFLSESPTEKKTGLIHGPGLTHAYSVFTESGNDAQIIIDDNSLVIEERSESTAPIKFMDYFATDFEKESFDFIYTHLAVSTKDRNKILKECSRLLKPEGILCTGELIQKYEKHPPSVTNLWKSSGILPILEDSIEPMYKLYKLEFLNKLDLSNTLFQVYSTYSQVLENEKSKLNDYQWDLLRKDIKKVKHESSMYSKWGARKYIAYKAFIFRKSN